MSRLPGWFSICLLLACFFLPITLGLTQLFTYLALVVLALSYARHRGQAAIRSSITWGAWLFAVCAILSIFTGQYFEESLSRIHRLFFLFLIPGIPYMAKQFRRELDGLRLVQGMTVAYLLGVVCLACYDVIRIPVFALQHGAWFDAGNMRDPQFYVTALCLGAAGFSSLGMGLKRRGTILGGLLVAAALVLHFKRGAWFSLLSMLALWSTFRRQWKRLVIGSLLIAVVAMLPPVQERLGNMRNEFSPQYGGRLDLWEHVAPKLIMDNPWGLGFKATQWADLRKHHIHVAQGLDHLHNNLLSITAETGVLGGLAWLGFMGAIAMVTFRTVRGGYPTNSVAHTLALGWGMAFGALFLNGLVEYNFGDSELYLLFCMLAAIQNMLWSERETALG